MALAAGFAGLVQAPSALTERTSLSVRAKNFSFSGPGSTLPARTYDLSLINDGTAPHVFAAVNLGPKCSEEIRSKTDGKALLHQIDAVPEEQQEALFASLCPGGSDEGDVFAPPGGQAAGSLALTSGKTLYFCPIGQQVKHYELGMIGFIKVP